jgi:hypothetical protein
MDFESITIDQSPLNPPSLGLFHSPLFALLTSNSLLKMTLTWVYDPCTGTVYTANYHPCGTGTAHQRLAHSVGLSSSGLIGGSIKADGTIAFRSESLNAVNYGMCDMSHSMFSSYIANEINSGNSISRIEFYRYAMGKY